MIHAHIKNRKAAPWWAAVGAPLIGVPLMVALLALASPEDRAQAVEPSAGHRTEQVETQVVHPTEFEAEYIEQHRRS